MIEPTRLDADRIILDRLRVGASVSLPRYIAANMELQALVDEVQDHLIVRLKSEVLAKTLEKRTIDQYVTFESPASTWQMFKKTHESGRWLGWIARRWPVAYATATKRVTVESRLEAVFPDASLKFPDTLGAPVYIERLVAQ